MKDLAKPRLLSFRNEYDTKKKNENLLPTVSFSRVLVLSSSFYLLQLLMQRGLGVLKFHGRRSFLLINAPLIGLLSTTNNLVLTQVLDDNVQHTIKKLKVSVSNYQQKSKNYMEQAGNIMSTIPKFLDESKDYFEKQYKEIQSNKYFQNRSNIRQLSLAVITFAVLERCFFRTACPSNSIQLGVFGNKYNQIRRSVLATSEVATTKEKELIQKLGKYKPPIHSLFTLSHLSVSTYRE